MTAAEVLALADAAGVVVSLRPDGTPTVSGNPNAALMAALKEHRAEIIRLLGGAVEPAKGEPQTCPGYVWRKKVKGEEVVVPVSCGATVYEPDDSDFFCAARAWCAMRLALRDGNGG